MEDAGAAWEWAVSNLPAWIVGALAVALVVGVLIKFAVPPLSNSLKDRAESRRADRAAERALIESERAARVQAVEELIRERTVTLAEREARRVAEQEGARCRDETDVLRQRIEQLEAMVPEALAAGRMRAESEEHLFRSLDLLSDGVTVSSVADEGTLLWVNAAFARRLGRTREEVLTLGWRALVHPEDRERTEAAETEAWGDEVTVPNRYLHRDGRWVSMRWFAWEYRRGVSVAFLPFRRVEDPVTVLENHRLRTREGGRA